MRIKNYENNYYIWLSDLEKLSYKKTGHGLKKLKNKINKICKKKDLEPVFRQITLNSWSESPWFCDLQTGIYVLMELKMSNGENCFIFLINYLLCLSSSPNTKNCLENIRNMFRQLSTKHQLDFISNLYKHGSDEIRRKLENTGSKKRRTSFTIPTNVDDVDQRWISGRLNKMMETLKFLFLPLDSEEYFSRNNDLDELHTSYHVDNVAKLVLENYSFDPILRLGLKQLICEMRALFIDILRDEDMRPILLASLFGNDDIEGKLRTAWLKIKTSNGISKKKMG